MQRNIILRIISGSVVAALIFLFYISGCSTVTSKTTTTLTSTTTTTLAYDSYFPLVEGRVITYEVLSTEDVPDVYASKIVYTTTIETWQYVGFVPLTSTLEVFKINVITGSSTTPYYYLEDSTGVYAYGAGSSPTTESDILLKYPLTVGITWESGTIWEPDEVLTQESLVTDSGTFLCRKVSYDNHPGTWDYRWFAKDVGMIKKYYMWAGAGTGWTTREIVSKNF